MKNFQKSWFIAGGWVVDIALGRVTREHDDLDICIYREDAKEALRYFKDWEIKVAVPGESRLVDYTHFSDLSLPRYCLHLFREKDFIEILLTERVENEVVFRKNKNITMHINEFSLKDRQGRPFVNPVWQLLFKSLNPREKDDEDFNNYVTIMDDQQKLWLASGIRIMKPDSVWLEKLTV
ncbi:nucleotidyltransferase domain-containing protein [Paenibacillus gansuensis]|uniref:Nucleotidyltransferase domain-containing protein n=2 Tax=Paenibacillus gansuensis TaxID=306542 RepID=A0ABW5P9N8_9BACL